jgi:hypothetical protein
MIPIDESEINSYKSILSEQKLGDLNPAKRPEVKQKIKDTFRNKKENFVILNLSKESLLGEINNLFLKYNNIKSILSYLRHNSSLSHEIERYTLFLNNANTSQRLYHLKYDVTEPGKCLTCSKTTKFENFTLGYKDYCSVKCVQNSPLVQDQKKKTLFKNYGVEHALQSESIQNKKKETNLNHFGSDEPFKCILIKEKIKATNLDRLGVENPFESNLIQEQIRQTNLEKYGVESPLQNREILEKTKQTNLERYGVENPAQNKEVQERTRRTTLEKFYAKLFTSDRLKNLVKPLFLLHEFRGVESRYKFQCIKCNNVFESHLQDGAIPGCLTCFPLGRSSYENSIYDFLKSVNTQNIIKDGRSTIPPLELDFYLPEHQLAIEFNGVFWHSEKRNKDSKYHLNKTNLCKAKGIQLIHIFEDEWIEKQEIVKSIIKNKLGLTENKIYARECEIKEVDKKSSKEFLFNNHLQEPINSKHNFGLYYNNELVYLISLSKPRFNKNYQFELTRSCPKINTSVVGGFNKLIKHAIKTLNIASIISYVDKRYFDGRGYKDWKLVGESKPNYFYMKDYQVRESRIKYQKHKLKDLFPDSYDVNLTEWQIMQLAGYDRIWDCGNIVFEYRPQN